MKLHYNSFDLRFHHPFTISKGTKTHQPTLIVALEHLGITGYGEAPAITYYDITVDKMIADIQAKKMFIEKFAFTEPSRYWHYLHHVTGIISIICCRKTLSSCVHSILPRGICMENSKTAAWMNCSKQSWLLWISRYLSAILPLVSTP